VIDLLIFGSLIVDCTLVFCPAPDAAAIEVFDIERDNVSEILFDRDLHFSGNEYKSINFLAFSCTPTS